MCDDDVCVLIISGFHGGQTAYLDRLNPDGSWARTDECCFQNITANFTNRINPDTVGPVYVENLLAELDQAEEYWVNQQTRTLYYVHNTTHSAAAASPPPAAGNQSRLGVVLLQNLLNIRGHGVALAARAQPSQVARDITIRGIGFRDAGVTYMNPHGMPSGGDWALQSPQYKEAGAVYLTGTEAVLITNCTFKYLDGNGIFLAGYNRNVTITSSELTHIGDSPIALWVQFEIYDTHMMMM